MEKNMKKDFFDKINRGIVIVDKPSGPTSFQVTSYVKKQLGLNKCAHAGTLDPAVTGVLPILLGRASRLLGYFIHRDKEYVGIMHLHENIHKKELEKTIKSKFIGKIKQLPPRKSRVKREERERKIYSFEILEKKGRDVLFRVKCEAGTYIRKLIHDLGQELEVGAHMLELRRTKASIFTEDEAINLYDFTKAADEARKGNTEKIKKILKPIEVIKEIMPAVEVKEKAVQKLKHGSPLFLNMLKNNKQIKSFKNQDFIAVMGKEKLIGVFQPFSGQKEMTAKPKTILV